MDDPMMRMALAAAVSAVLVAFGAAFAAAPRGPERPPVFDERPYAEAREAAKKEQKWFIVKATAEWCGPCKQMNRTTWRDPKVVEWLNAHAIAVELDVDEERGLARELAVRAMPTMIAFKEGRDEFDRVVGYKGPAEFLGWLEGVQKGEKGIEAAQAPAAAPQTPRQEADARYDKARKFLEKRDYAGATEEFAWLWEHTKGMAGYGGVRGSFMSSAMERLAAAHEPARERFAEFRDEMEKLLAGEKVQYADLLDWLVLNEVVGERERTLAWFDRVKHDPRWRPLLDRGSHRLEKLLIANKRWPDVGLLYADPLEKLERSHAFQKMYPKPSIPEWIGEDRRREFEEAPARRFREDASIIYAGLLAAGRQEAAAVASRARELDPSDAMAVQFVRMAMAAGEPRAEHADWLEPAAAEDASVRELLEQVRQAAKERGK